MGSPVEELLGPGIPPKAILIGDSILRGAYAGERFSATDTSTFHLFRTGLFVTTMAHHLGMAVNLPRYNDSLEEQNMFDTWKFTAVLLGTNDYASSTPIEKVMAQYAKFLDTAVSSSWYQHPNAAQTIFCVTPLTQAMEGKNRAGYTLPELRTALQQTCAMRSLPVIDGGDLLPKDPLLAVGKKSHYRADGLHLNKLGQRLLAEQLLEWVLVYFAELGDGSQPMMSLSVEGHDAVLRSASLQCKVGPVK
jgi:hypothetical protein